MAHSPTLSLDARYYTDPAIYQKERRGLFRRTWQFAGHVAELPEAGSYFTFEVGGERLFCIRGNDHVVRTFYNVCQHRAHELLKGRGTTRLIVCPYHAWSYELGGALRSGPNLRSVPGFDKQSICLTEVRTENFHGFLFVNLDPEAEPMDVWYPGVRDELSAFVPKIADLAPLTWMEIPESCNWKVSVENYSECYHCPGNHPTFATGVVKASTYDIQPDADGGYVLRHTTECQDLERMSYPIDLQANEHAGDYQSWFLWPMFSFQCYPGNVLNTYHWRGHSVDQCTVWRGWYSAHGEADPVIEALARQDRETTVAEDITLVESVFRGLQSAGYRPGPLVVDPAGGVMSEHAIARLQQWMRAAVDNEPTALDARSS